jgi:4-hydroxythreonine-4-phosphate dehydrogenase
MRPLLGITMGDPAGVGGEIIAKALTRSSIREICRPLVIGDARIMKLACSQAARSDLEVRSFDPDSNPAAMEFDPTTVNVLDLANVDPAELEYGKVGAAWGRAAFQYIETAIHLAMEGQLHGTVTAPIHKLALNRAGIDFPGHTEIFASLTGTRDFTMMLVEGKFRVVHVTGHLSLRDALENIRRERILVVIRLTWEMLRRIGVAEPRIAVAGLNPHAGDGGLFGNEEEREILPAVEEARALGIRAEGPFPPDTCFPRAAGGVFDAAVAMYHDQGHIPIKMRGFRWDKSLGQWSSVGGVNVTLGLPIIRTSVDHGVAFDIAGRGIASEESMVAAIELAARMAESGKAET